MRCERKFIDNKEYLDIVPESETEQQYIQGLVDLYYTSKSDTKRLKDN